MLRTARKSMGLIVLSAAALTAFAGQALAQDKGAPLGGPKVRDNAVPGVARPFGDESPRNKENMGSRPLPQRAFMRAVNTLKGDKAAEGMRLTEAQEGQIKDINQKFEASMKDYRDKNAPEVKTLAADLPPRERRRAMEMLRGPEGRGEGRPEGRPEGRGQGRGENRPGDEMGGPDSGPEGREVDAAAAQKAQTRLKEIFEASPKPADAQSQILGVLNEGQKKAVATELATMRGQAEDRMKEGRGKGGAEGGTKGGPQGGPKGGPEGGREGQAGGREAIREKLKNMSPDERRKFMEERRGGAPK